MLSIPLPVEYRRWSNRVDLAYKMCIVCPLFWLLCFGHRLVLYRGSNGKCAAMGGLYASIDSYAEASLTAMGTPIMMITLGCLLFRSVHDVTHRRIVPSEGGGPVILVRRTMFPKLEGRLAIMLMSQSLIAVVTRVPYASEVIYSNVTQSWPKSPMWKAIEDVVIETIRLFSYTFFTTSFYISLISNQSFRHKIKKIFRKSLPSIATSQ